MSGPYRRVCGGVGGHHPAYLLQSRHTILQLSTVVGLCCDMYIDRSRYELQEVIVVDDTHPITRGVTSFE